jgi:hypothetical protein
MKGWLDVFLLKRLSLLKSDPTDPVFLTLATIKSSVFIICMFFQNEMLSGSDNESANIICCLGAFSKFSELESIKFDNKYYSASVAFTTDLDQPQLQGYIFFHESMNCKPQWELLESLKELSRICVFMLDFSGQWMLECDRRDVLWIDASRHDWKMELRETLELRKWPKCQMKPNHRGLPTTNTTMQTLLNSSCTFANLEGEGFDFQGILDMQQRLFLSGDGDLDDTDRAFRTIKEIKGKYWHGLTLFQKWLRICLRNGWNWQNVWHWPLDFIIYQTKIHNNCKYLIIKSSII